MIEVCSFIYMCYFMLWSYLISSTVLCRYLHPLEYILFDRMLFTREGPFMCPKSHACSMYLLLDLHSFYNVARLLSKLQNLLCRLGSSIEDIGRRQWALEDWLTERVQVLQKDDKRPSTLWGGGWGNSLRFTSQGSWGSNHRIVLLMFLCSWIV